MFSGTNPAPLLKLIPRHFDFSGFNFPGDPDLAI